MAYYITESFILKDEKNKNSFQVYMNNKGKLFLTELDEELQNPFFITISKEDWIEMKKFIDEQFESFEK